MSNDDNIQRAIADIAIIRRMLDSNKTHKHDPARTVGWQASLIIQGTALLLSVIFLANELMNQNSLTQAILATKDDSQLRWLGLALMGMILLFAIALAYYVVIRAAKIADSDIDTFITRNFSYLKSLTLVSDILIKFSFIAVLILVGHPELLAPVLLIFIGDFLIQGRLWNLSVKNSLILGLCSIFAGFIQYSLHSDALVFPLIVFATVSGLSMIAATHWLAGRKNEAV